jgi:GTP cyclohydrolase I
MADTIRALSLFTEGFDKILAGLELLGYPTDTDANYVGTAARAAKGLGEMVLCTRDVETEIATMLSRTFPAKYDEMVISKHNSAFGLCPHHLLPVVYRISVAYIPSQKVLGISKLSRLCMLLAKRPVLQEDLTQQLAQILHVQLESRGAACYVEGLHMCMAARGANKHEARVVTSAVHGVFRESELTRQEFLHLVTAGHPSLV